MTPVHVVSTGISQPQVQSLEGRCLLSAATTLQPVPADPLGLISLPINSPTTGPVSLMVSGHFNGDKNVDLLVRASNEPFLRLYPGHGNGKFGPPGEGINAGFNPTALATGDFNHDGNLDVAVANDSGPTLTVMSSVTILLGKGDGTFKIADGVFGGQRPTALAVADFNHDGAQDLVVASSMQWSPPGTLQPTSYGAAVLYGKGDGTFQGPRKIFLDNPQTSVAVGDVNGDHLPDVLLGGPFLQSASPLPLPRLWTAINNGQGGFDVTASSPFIGRIGGLVSADLNGDHMDDLAALQVYPVATPTATTTLAGGEATVHTLLSKGDGTFVAKDSMNTPINHPAGISAADLNRDGRMDFVVSGVSARPTATAVPVGIVAVVRGTGDGSLGLPILFRTGPAPAAQVIADANGDGRPDIITGGVAGITTILNHPRPIATTAVDLVADVLTIG